MICLKISGMTCAACSARVERALKNVPNVDSVVVNLLTNSARIEGSADVCALVDAVRSAGYDAQDVNETVRQGPSTSNATSAPQLFWTPALLSSIVLLLALFYVATGAAMLRFPIPRVLANPGALGIVQLLLASVCMFVNRRFFIDGVASMIRLAPNMDALVALGSGVSFLYSFAVLIAVVDAYAVGESSRALELGGNYYFESAAAILVFIGIGKRLEERAKGKTTSALDALAKLVPDKACVVRNDVEIEIDANDVKRDEVFLVRPGGRVPVDGIVLEGFSAIDESALTGESAPIDKLPDSRVFAGTLNSFGFLRCRASKVGSETTLAQICRLTSDAAASKAPVARLADKIAGVFVPSVVAFAVLTVVVWLVLGKSWDFALVRGITVLTISCPCALGLATPASIMVGMGVGTKRGLLFKTAEALEYSGKAKTIVLDKTGVITTGRPVVSSWTLAEGVDEQEFLAIVGALESKSEHPLAQAALQFVRDRGVDVLSNALEAFQIAPGAGVCGLIDGERVLGGKLDYLRQTINVPDEIIETTRSWSERGETTLFFAHGSRLLGALGAADALKEDSVRAINAMKKLVDEVVMLTGDSKQVAETIGKRTGIEQIVADVLPDGKEQTIRELARQGRVVFVGDGVNDAPALARADVGIAAGAGTDVAIDAADVVLTSNRLDDVCAAVRLGRATLRNIRENLFWAFCYNVVGVPFAAGFLTPLFGWTFSPAFGALAMSLSSFCVVSNALRLNYVKLDGKSAKEKNACPVEEGKYEEMKKTMIVKGMMCGHCEARVKKTLEALPFVIEALVDHTKGTAIVTLNAAPANVDDVLTKTVVEQGYDVISIA